jgi:hypothetical protein
MPVTRRFILRLSNSAQSSAVIGLSLGLEMVSTNFRLYAKSGRVTPMYSYGSYSIPLAITFMAVVLSIETALLSSGKQPYLSDAASLIGSDYFCSKEKLLSL